MKNSQTLLKVAFILVLILGMHQTLSAQVTEQDSLALVALYNSADGPNWTHNDNWLSGPVSTWYGVTVSGDRVTGLELTDNNLSGTIPPEISALTRLDFLILYENHLTGSIPPEIGDLTHLETLGLSENQFDGSIPAEIGNLTNLAALYLLQNQLSGTLPVEIGNLTRLGRLSLAANQLTGEIPPEIGNLTNLQVLYLSDNQLSGRIPTEMGQLTKLKTLSLYNNALSDTVKVNFANLKNLKELHLNGNEFVGSLPAGLDSLPALQNLWLSNNRFTDLQNLSPDTSLTKLSISNNRFTFKDIEPNVWVETFYYSPQDSVGEAQDTTIDVGTSLDLSVSVGGSANQYQWTKDGVDIPGATSSSYQISSAEWADIGVYICKITNTIATKLTLYSRPITVDVAGAVSPLDQDSLALVALYNSTDGPNWTHNDNWLSGPLADWYGVTLANDRVYRVELTANNLAGPLPPEIGDLTELYGLYLSENQLSGALPPEIGNLVNLQALGLQQNQLSDSIPDEIANLTALRHLLLSYNRFSGSVPQALFNLTELTFLQLHNNQFSGVVPTEFERLTNLMKLTLSNNQLTDTIKVNFAGMKRLRWLYLSYNDFTGPVPVGLDSLPELIELNLSSNHFTDLHDLYPDTSLTKLSISNNRFTFKDIEPNVWVETFYYSPQDSVGEERDTTIAVGEPLELAVLVGGTANQYQWMKDGDDIPGAIGSTYAIASTGENDIGDYVCKITNTLATQLTLHSRPIHVTVSGATGVSGRNTATPKEFALHQNYPNPFNPTTSIAFSVAKATHVELTVFDRLGREVATPVNRKYRPGQYNIKFDAGQLASGLYFYRMRMGDFLRTRKMLLVR